jgi:hypothetical protein
VHWQACPSVAGRVGGCYGVFHAGCASVVRLAGASSRRRSHARSRSCVKAASVVCLAGTSLRHRAHAWLVRPPVLRPRERRTTGRSPHVIDKTAVGMTIAWGARLGARQRVLRLQLTNPCMCVPILPGPLDSVPPSGPPATRWGVVLRGACTTSRLRACG